MLNIDGFVKSFSAQIFKNITVFPCLAWFIMVLYR